METKRAGWLVGRSIAAEIDAALEIVIGNRLLSVLPEELASLERAIPAGWREEGQAMLGTSWFSLGVLEGLASMAGVLLEGDYHAATRTMRGMTVEDAMARVRAQAAEAGIDPAGAKGTTPTEVLRDLALRLYTSTYSEAGLEIGRGGRQASRIAEGLEVATRVLQGGDLHKGFWPWIDRFYDETYGPWSRTRMDAMQEQATRASSALGAPERDGDPPDFSWLPPQNPLLRYPELQREAVEGTTRIFFWVEPFGLADAWALYPEIIFVSFAEPGTLYENFRACAESAAARAQALADPTRLIILRMIRDFGMINTEMAGYLGLSRPTVSIHAKILREAGLITSRSEGRFVRHEIIPGELRRLFADLENFLDIEREPEA